MLEELHLLKRRLVVAKAERLDDVADAQLAFDRLLAETQAIEKVLDAASGDAAAADASSTDKIDKKKRRERTGDSPPGRRDLEASLLPIVRVELTDPELEGKADRIGADESSRVAYERGGYRRLVVARIVYDTTNGADGRAAHVADPQKFRTVTAPLPREITARGMLAPSMIARLLTMKYVLGVPFYRYEKHCAAEGFALDRATMGRYAEHVGATLGCIVEAARKEAIATAF